MSQYAMITQQGLNEINTAHPLGEYIEIAYYVPVYDYKIDPNIGVMLSGVSATEVSTVTNSADEVPTGEIIWNTSATDAYSLSEDLKYLTQTGNETTATSGGGGYTVNNYAHRDVFSINQYLSSALSTYYTADTVISPGNLGTNWYFSNAGSELTSTPTSADNYGPESLDSPTSDKLYAGVTYQNVITSADESRANFKVTIRCPVGSFRFNKLALYAVKRTEDGIIAADPFLFAQVIIPEPQILYSNQTGSNAFALSEITLDFQIETQTVSASFEDIFYSTSGDYWVRTTNENNGQYGLSYDGTVYISNRLAVDDRGNFLNTSADRGVSKLFVSTFENINQPTTSAEQDMPQLCLQYVENANLNRIRTTLKTTVSGDCEVDLYGACTSGHGGRFSVMPAIDKEFGLGFATDTTLDAKRWYHLYLSDKLEMFDDAYDNVLNSDAFRGFYVKMNSFDNEVRFSNADVYCGPYYSSAMVKTLADGTKYFDGIPNTRYIHGNISSFRASASDGDGTAYVSKNLLIRSLNDIIMITFNEDDADSSWATEDQIVTEIWNLKDGKSPDISDNLGVNRDIVMVAGRNLYTYGNIIPLTHDRDNIGEQYKGIKKLWVKHIGYAKETSTERFNAIKCDTAFVPNSVGLLLGDSQHKWDKLYAKNVGWASEYVEKGFITELSCNGNILMKVDSDSSDGIKFTDGVIIDRKSIYADEMGTIVNIGKDENRVGTLYVDNLVVTNTGLTETAYVKLIKSDPDLTVWTKLDEGLADKIYLELNLLKTTHQTTSDVTFEGTISCRGYNNETIRDNGWGSVPRTVFEMRNIKTHLGVTGILSMVIPTGNITTQELGTHPSTNTGSIEYDNTNDILKVNQVNTYVHNYSQGSGNVWKVSDVKIRFILS